MNATPMLGCLLAFSCFAMLTFICTTLNKNTMYAQLVMVDTFASFFVLLICVNMLEDPGRVFLLKKEFKLFHAESTMNATPMLGCLLAFSCFAMLTFICTTLNKNTMYAQLVMVDTFASFFLLLICVNMLESIILFLISCYYKYQKARISTAITVTVLEALQHLEKVNVTLNLVEEAMVERAKEMSLKTQASAPQETTASTQEHSTAPSCQESFSEAHQEEEEKKGVDDSVSASSTIPM